MLAAMSRIDTPRLLDRRFLDLEEDSEARSESRSDARSEDNDTPPQPRFATLPILTQSPF